MSDTLLLVSRDIGRVVERVGSGPLMDELIDALTDALFRFDEDVIRVVQRHGFTYDRPHPGVLEWMPAMREGEDAAIKIVSYNPSNPSERAMPTILSTISLYDVATGRLVALLDGTLPTALRTGAASAVATGILARPDSSVIGLIGCGAQAVTQLHALSRRFPIRTVLAYDIDPDVSRTLAARVGFLGLPVRIVPRDVIEREADILCTATSAEPGTGPVVDDRAFNPWIHVNAVGSDLPGKTELSPEFLRRSLVCPDFVEQALVEGEAQQLTADELGPCLSDLVKAADRYRPWRERPTVFDSTGFVLEDVVVADLFVKHARRLGLGTQVPLQALDGDPRNPYADLDLGVVGTDLPAVARRSS